MTIPEAWEACEYWRAWWRGQVAKPDFFLKTTPMFDAGDNVGMVLTPQYNSNLSKTNDIFNHSNLHFWWYMQPGESPPPPLPSPTSPLGPHSYSVM